MPSHVTGQETCSQCRDLHAHHASWRSEWADTSKSGRRQENRVLPPIPSLVFYSQARIATLQYFIKRISSPGHPHYLQSKHIPCLEAKCVFTTAWLLTFITEKKKQVLRVELGIGSWENYLLGNLKGIQLIFLIHSKNIEVGSESQSPSCHSCQDDAHKPYRCLY